MPLTYGSHVLVYARDFISIGRTKSTYSDTVHHWDVYPALNITPTSHFQTTTSHFLPTFPTIQVNCIRYSSTALVICVLATCQDIFEIPRPVTTQSLYVPLLSLINFVLFTQHPRPWHALCVPISAYWHIVSSAWRNVLEMPVLSLPFQTFATALPHKTLVHNGLTPACVIWHHDDTPPTHTARAMPTQTTACTRSTCVHPPRFSETSLVPFHHWGGSFAGPRFQPSLSNPLRKLSLSSPPVYRHHDFSLIPTHDCYAKFRLTTITLTHLAQHECHGLPNPLHFQTISCAQQHATVRTIIPSSPKLRHRYVLIHIVGGNCA